MIDNFFDFMWKIVKVGIFIAIIVQILLAIYMLLKAFGG